MILQRYEVQFRVRGMDHDFFTHKRCLTHDGATLLFSKMQLINHRFEVRIYDRKKKEYVRCS